MMGRPKSLLAASILAFSSAFQRLPGVAVAGTPQEIRLNLPAGWLNETHGRRRKRSTDGERARQSGIPKAFRRYCKRYGKGVTDMIMTHRRFPADTLDHGRDRALARDERSLDRFLKLAA